MSPPLIRDATSGFWGFPTSTMDWCEENYAVTWYIAEFWNTLSNVCFIIPPIVAVCHLRKSRIYENRYIVTLMLLAMIGFGSFAFHCSLLYQSQLLDELPMIYGTCAMLYCILECNKSDFGVLNFILFILISILVTVVYISFENPLIFLWCYGLLSSTSLIFHINACIKHDGCKQLLIISTLSYGFGFILWNIDNEFCYQVRDLRNSLPSLLRPLLQLHAWWHFFAGAGTYLCIMYSVHIRIKCLGYRPRLKYLINFIPFYERDGSLSKEAATSWTDLNKNMSSMHSKYRNNGSVGNFARLL